MERYRSRLKGKYFILKPVVDLDFGPVYGSSKENVIARKEIRKTKRTLIK